MHLFFGIPRVDVDVTDFLMEITFRSAGISAYCIHFLAYVARDVSPRKMRRCKACNGGIQMLDMLIGPLLAELPGVLPGVLAGPPGLLAVGIFFSSLLHTL